MLCQVNAAAFDCLIRALPLIRQDIRTGRRFGPSIAIYIHCRRRLRKPIPICIINEGRQVVRHMAFHGNDVGPEQKIKPIKIILF